MICGIKKYHPKVVLMAIGEHDLYIPALECANRREDGFISTSDLIEKLTEIFNPTGEDALQLDGRSDTRFSQVVRNIISHRNDSPNNLIHMGYATYDKDRGGIQITEQGKKFLQPFIR